MCAIDFVSRAEGFKGHLGKSIGARRKRSKCWWSEQKQELSNGVPLSL
jgi:hypothetical protein